MRITFALLAIGSAFGVGCGSATTAAFLDERVDLVVTENASYA